MIPISYPSPRVAQLDAQILDGELIGLLKEKLASVFQHHQTSWWTLERNPELWSLFLNLIIFKSTVWKTGSSYGLKLQNLKLTDLKLNSTIGKSKKLILLGLLVGGFAYNKFLSYVYSIEDGDITERRKGLINYLKKKFLENRIAIVTRIDKCLKVVNLLNFVLFLVNGKFPSLVHRLLGISLTPIVSDLMKFNGNNVNYEFQNRQLVWNVMTEFLVFILPLLQLRKIRKLLRKTVLSSNSDIQGKENEIQSKFRSLPISNCAICRYNSEKATLSGNKKLQGINYTITNPYVTNCGHIYCYVCISTRFNAMDTDGDNTCLRCGEQLKWFKEYGVEEVDEDAIMVSYEEVEEPVAMDDNEEDSASLPADEEKQVYVESDDGENSDNDSDSDSSLSEDQEYDADDYEFD